VFLAGRDQAEVPQRVAEAVRAHLGGAAQRFELIWVPRLPDGMARRLAEAERLARERSALLVFFCDLDAPDRVILHLADPLGGRVLTRVVDRREAGEEGRFEALAAIVSSTYEALVRGGSLGVHARPLAAPPLPPVIARPRPRTRFAADLGVGYRLAGYAAAPRLAHSLTLSAGLDLRWGLGLEVEYGYAPDLQRETSEAVLYLEQHAATLQLRWVWRHRWFSLAARLGGVLQATRHRIETRSPELEPFLAAGDRDPATVRLASEPAGAEVALDGLRIGATPLSIRVAPGRRQLSMKLPGHHAVEEWIEAIADRTVTVTRRLVRTDAPVVVAPGRPVATVQVQDDRRRGGRTEAPGLPDPPQVEPPALPADAGVSSGEPRPVPPTPGELMRQAAQHRARGEAARAAALYQQVLSAHGTSAEATTCLALLGQLQLGALGQPAAALVSFGRYLAIAPRGALAPEAALGRILALRQLGRRVEEHHACRRFVQEYPGSPHAAAIRARIETLGRSAVPDPNGGMR
jgi:hypothetical protein